MCSCVCLIVCLGVRLAVWLSASLPARPDSVTLVGGLDWWFGGLNAQLLQRVDGKPSLASKPPIGGKLMVVCFVLFVCLLACCLLACLFVLFCVVLFLFVCLCPCFANVKVLEV